MILKIVRGRVDHAVDNWLKCFCGGSYAKEGKTRRGKEKISHVLCRFADHSFDCYRLIGELWLIYKILFCRALEKEDGGAPSKYNMLILLQLVKHYINLCCANGYALL